MFKFIHAADIHLDSPLKGLEKYEGAPVELLRSAPRRALENLIGLALKEKVDFVLIAGDLYDGDWRDFGTPLFFLNQASRLREAGIPIYLIAGNHDAASKISKSMPLPDHVKMFAADRAHSIEHPGLEVVIHGQSFAHAKVTEDLSLNYPAAVPGCFNIGMLHTTVDGREGHDRYAPSSLSTLKMKGYDYWALGHIHQREILCEKPLIAYSGNIQGRHIREPGVKGCLLVEVDRDFHTAVQFKPLSTVCWELLSLDVGGTDEPDDLIQQIRSGLEQRLTSRSQDTSLSDSNHPAVAGGSTLALRVQLQGATQLHQQLLAQQDDWIARIRGLANEVSGGMGELWIEKVLIQTHLPKASAGTAVWQDAAATEMAQLFHELRKSDAAALELNLDLNLLQKKIPLGLKEEWGLVSEISINDYLDKAESLLSYQLFQASITADQLSRPEPANASELQASSGSAISQSSTPANRARRRKRK